MNVSPQEVVVTECDVCHSMYVYRQPHSGEGDDPFEPDLELIDTIPSRDLKTIVDGLDDDVVAFQLFSSLCITVKVEGLAFELSDQGEKGQVEERQHESPWYVPGGKVVQKSDLSDEFERYADKRRQDTVTYVKTRVDTYLTFDRTEKFQVI